jgi:ferric-dicitrate binding protein FerR (iron transport regulator)
VAIAAAIAALVGLFGGVFNQSEQDQFIIHTVSSPVGQQTHTTLSDGTRVWLNSNSLIEVVKLSESERRIRLRGEAYLDVAKDASRPFVVETENMVVTVLGTEFNVNTYGKLQSVVLVNGKVQVTDRQEGTNYELTPGNRFEMDVETGDKTIRNVDTENFISWTNGYLKFESIPLKQVILQLQDYYGIVTTVTKEVDDSLLVSGKLELRKGIDKALESLCLISAVKYDWTAEDAITITGK